MLAVSDITRNKGEAVIIVYTMYTRNHAFDCIYIHTRHVHTHVLESQKSMDKGEARRDNGNERMVGP